MATYAYYRVSTQTQAEKNSTEMQMDVVETYCKKNGIVIDNVYTDNGISGAMDDLDESLMRPGMIEMLSSLNEGDLIIVQNTSRLWRSDTAKIMVRREIKKAKANIYSIEQPTYDIYKKDPNDFLINEIMEILDEYDKMQISMKLAKGRIARAKSGNKPCGAAPYGYKWDGNSIVIDYNNHLVVRDIFAMCVEFKGNLSKISRECSNKGYKTSRGNDFSVQAIKNILQNDFYIGIVTYADKKTQGEHEAVVEKELFEKSNNFLSK